MRRFSFVLALATLTALAACKSDPAPSAAQPSATSSATPTRGAASAAPSTCVPAKPPCSAGCIEQGGVCVPDRGGVVIPQNK